MDVSVPVGMVVGDTEGVIVLVEVRLGVGVMLLVGENVGRALGVSEGVEVGPVSIELKITTSWAFWLAMNGNLQAGNSQSGIVRAEPKTYTAPNLSSV